MIMSTASISASPVSAPPIATWKTSAGTPDSTRHWANSSDVSGVTSDGLTTTALPAASAGIASPTELTSG